MIALTLPTNIGLFKNFEGYFHKEIKKSKHFPGRSYLSVNLQGPEIPTKRTFQFIIGKWTLVFGLPIASSCGHASR
jgi:hypothetical protein